MMHLPEGSACFNPHALPQFPPLHRRLNWWRWRTPVYMRRHANRIRIVMPAPPGAPIIIWERVEPGIVIIRRCIIVAPLSRPQIDLPDPEFRKCVLHLIYPAIRYSHELCCERDSSSPAEYCGIQHSCVLRQGRQKTTLGTAAFLEVSGGINRDMHRFDLGPSFKEPRLDDDSAENKKPSSVLIGAFPEGGKRYVPVSFKEIALVQYWPCTG